MSPETMPQPSAFESLVPDYGPETNYDDYITEDDTPVDNPYSEKQQRFLAGSLHESWKGPGDGRPFVAMSNVGFFYKHKTPAIVPDMMLSLDVSLPEDIWLKQNRSYFLWNYGKPPELVVEVVSNREGGELDDKPRIYARCGVDCYIVWDPELHLRGEKLLVYELVDGNYLRMPQSWFPKIGLGLVVWRGLYEDMLDDWLRWCDQDGNVMPTAQEQLAAAVERAVQAKKDARIAAENEAKARDDATKHEARIQRLLAQLQKAGLEPENGEAKAE